VSYANIQRHASSFESPFAFMAWLSDNGAGAGIAVARLFMPLGKRQRKLLLGLCLGLALILLLPLSLPLWFPWVLRPLAAKYGASYATYEREGYSRLALRQVTFTNGNIRLRAASIETLVPTLWLWRSIVQKSTSAQPVLRVDGWQLEVLSSGGGVRTKAPSVYHSVQQTRDAITKLQNWVPAATVSHGNIRFSDTDIQLPSVGWSNGNLRVTAAGLQMPKLQHLWSGISTQAIADLMVNARLAGPQSWQINIGSDSLRLQSAIRISSNNSGIDVQSAIFWWSNEVALQSQFARTGALPDTASLQAKNVHLAGRLFGLSNYRELSGSVLGTWQRGEFLLALKANAVPVTTATNLPPVHLELHASGGTNSAIVHSAAISSPWLQAELSHDFRIYFTEKLVREPAAMKVRLDLAKQPWLALAGVLDGEAQISPGEGKFPVVEFRVGGSDVGNTDLKAVAFKTEGSLAWPGLNITHADATFEDGSIAAVQGKLDFAEKTILGGRFNLNGGLARRWLPAGYSYENLEVSGSVAGPVKSPRHSGHIVVTNFTSPPFEPLQVKADWSGEQMHLERVAAVISAGESSISLEGGVALASAEKKMTVSTLALNRAGQSVLALEHPAALSLSRSAVQTNHWLARLDAFALRGTAGEIQAQANVDWPISGAINASVQNVHSAMLDDFLKTRAEPFEIRSLKAQAGWSNGPVVFLINGSAAMRPQKDLPLSGLIDVRGDAQGIIISNLVVSSQTSSVAVAHGFLPISFNPGVSTNRLNFDPQKPFQLNATTEPQTAFWEKVAAWTDLTLTAPNLRLNVSGTLQAPRGVVEFQAAQIKFRKAPAAVPAFDDIDLSLRLDRQTARLFRGNCLVQGQLVNLSGEVPLSESFWTRETKIPNWTNATAHLQIDHAQLAAFTSLAPQLLSPQGEIDLKLDLQPGAKLDGNVIIRDARTRVLPVVGPVRGIDIDLKIHEKSARLESATVNIGGATVVAEGQADLREMNWRQLAIPPFKFILRGTNVPLARQPESIIRSDLALTLTKTNDSPAILSGTARLRNSYYLHELSDLVSPKVASPGRRPPYFSIEEEPLADWRLSVRVTGEHCMKVRSTIFSGEVSANLNLSGTLKEPVALGDARVDSGFVRFPFASLKVQQGFVTLSSQDPYRPQLLITATARQYGYDIKLEVSGPADAPVLQFSSTPPLSSEQVLLMVTAGELPREERSLSTQQRAQTLALFVGRDLLAKLGFGDDKEQRLTIHSGEQLSEQGRPTYNVEYELTDRWSLVGEYDRFNAYNAGLKWRIYSK